MPCYAVSGSRLGPTEVAYYYRAFQYGVGYQAKIKILANMGLLRVLAARKHG